MQSLEELSRAAVPAETVLLLGAGASVPSGAPTAASLARALAQRLGRELGDLSLAEICSIYENKLQRRALAEQIRSQLQPLTPTGGLLLLPSIPWHRIYGTNFDQLLEKAYAIAGIDLAVRRSNADFSTPVPPTATEYLKLHGCITTDVAFGHQSRMLLTVRDYEEFADFREASFRHLTADITTKHVLIVGQSLADGHLRTLVQDVARLHAKAGTPGRVFLLVYERDDDRAEILEQGGITVTFGGIDDLMHAMLAAGPARTVEEFVLRTGRTPVPAEVLGSATDVEHAGRLPSNVQRMFNGAPATYGDVAAGHTFPRAVHDRLALGLSADKPVLTLIGAAGVGKTTLARQIALGLSASGVAVWEHNPDYPFDAQYWVEYEERLRKDSQTAVLVIDDCIGSLAQLNRLVNAIGAVPKPALRLIATASTGQWRSRTKSRYVFSRGNAEVISRLVDHDIEQLLVLIEREDAVRSLVDPAFSRLSRKEQLQRLRDRCSADMFVCLKNIFATEELDSILLREYKQLTAAQRDVYRHVAALEALEARVHRQLVLRVLGIESGLLEALLRQLEGVVDEYEIRPRDGLYGWNTRHSVIAKKIADYKYADQDELYGLFSALVAGLNPGEWLEVDTAKALCREEYGIQRLGDPSRQLELLQALVRLLPGERVIRHALVRKHVDVSTIEVAGQAYRHAVAAVGETSPLARYRIYLTLRRATESEDLLPEDRLAILLEAARLAERGVDAYPADKHAYKVYGQVGAQLAQLGGSLAVLDDAIARAQGAEDKLLDPDLSRYRRDMTRARRLAAAATAAPIEEDLLAAPPEPLDD